MTRPCFLVVDREYGGTISTRKLVLESAKLNVITAYSGDEAIETLKQFPAVDGVVLNSAVEDMPCEEVVKVFRQIRPEVLIIAIGTPLHSSCDGADHQLDSFEPAKLLNLLNRVVPNVAKVWAREQQTIREDR